MSWKAQQREYGFDLCNYINILHIKSNKETSIRMKIKTLKLNREKQMDQKCLLNEFMKIYFLK